MSAGNLAGALGGTGFVFFVVAMVLSASADLSRGHRREFNRTSAASFALAVVLVITAIWFGATS